MRVVSGELAFLHEVDDAEWLPVPEAAARLSYPRDQAILEAAAG
jgi:predicted NUDIX family NTP pyrophosphohydrolase